MVSRNEGPRRFRQLWIAAVLAALALVAVACGATTETPAAMPTEAVPAAAPLPTDVPRAEDGILPTVSVTDQAIGNGQVLVSRVVSDGPGWVVIHSQADGKPGLVLGYSPVSDGDNANVAVQIDTANATETMYAMLHTDAGEIGTWEFPDGPDAPVQVDGQTVTPAFVITGGLAAPVNPSVTVADQTIVDGQVIISRVVSDGPGWLVVHAQADGKPGPILGYSPVSDGENANVTVQIDAASATETLYAMLHTDAGEIGTWEFPDGPDAPVHVDGQTVTPAFVITGGLAAPANPSVTVADQAIMDGQLVIYRVVSNGPGWLVVHAQADGKPGPILGYSPVSDGDNANVVVQIDAANATGTLYAMLHTDAGEIGAWEFPDGPDTPVQVKGQVVTPAFVVTGGLAAPPAPAVTPAVTVANQALVGSTVTIAQVVSDGPGWLIVHAQADGAPGPVVGHSPVSNGTNSGVVVQIDLSAATATLYAMLHTDAGTVGAWEFPNGPDAPVQVNGQVVTPAFNLQVLSGEGEVEIEDFRFRPNTLVVRVGTTVKWANKDQAAHTATSDTGVWDSGYLAKGDRFTFTFTEPGVYPYYCLPHGGPGGVGMAGTIIVLP